ncbi:MAG: hypothetical protein Q9205_002977 [Flavoplaca limonia]
MSAIPILGPLKPPFAELLHLQATTPFAFTRHKAKKMQSTGREMRVVEEAAPLQELEPKPMQQETFSAILEHEKEAKEPKATEAVVQVTADIPVIAGVQAAGEVSDGENDELFDAKESPGRSDNDSITPWDSISYSPPVAPPGPHSGPHGVAPLVASSVAPSGFALPQPVDINQQFLDLLRGAESACLPQPRTEDTSVPVTPSSPTRGRMIPPHQGGHRRNGSEFIGGDGKNGLTGLMSTSPTKGEGPVHLNLPRLPLLAKRFPNQE